MTDTRNVLLKCRASLLSMTHYDAPAEHVIVGCHHSVLSIIRAVLLLCVVELPFCFCQNKHFLYLQVPGIDIAMDWQVHHPTPNRSIHAPRSAGNTFIHACVVFLPHLHVFLRITLPSSLPFVTHIRGHMARAPLPSPLPCVPSF